MGNFAFQIDREISHTKFRVLREARVCWQLYVLHASHALVQATVGVGTVIIVYIGVAYTGGGAMDLILGLWDICGCFNLGGLWTVLIRVIVPFIGRKNGTLALRYNDVHGWYTREDSY